MSPDELDQSGSKEPRSDEPGDTLQIDAQADEAEGSEEPREKIELEVKIDRPSACERHMTVTIPRQEVDRYLDKAFSELMPTASVPGFRAGRAPRKLVEHRFKREITDQVKGSLLMDSMAQISEEQELTAISEPDIDLEAVEVPDEGPMTFEFDVEVRPEFDLPQWKGLQIERAMKEFTDEDVDRRLESILARFGQLAPHEGKAKAGDFVTVNITATHDGHRLATSREQSLRIRPVLSFHDGRLENFDKLMQGAAPGETREGEVELTADARNEDLRGKKVKVSFEVLEVKKLELPELTPTFLDELGGFESVDKLRDAIRKDLQRQLDYHRQQQARRQIAAALVESADWELPPTMLRRQSHRELERAVLELRRNGFNESEIRARENELRQHSAAATARALKEHFILERIAEDEKIEVESQDFDAEIALIAAQSGESVRRVRAQLEKRGLMDSLHNQIIERKAIDLVLAQARFKDVPLPTEKHDAEAIDLAAGGGEQEIAPNE